MPVTVMIKLVILLQILVYTLFLSMLSIGKESGLEVRVSGFPETVVSTF
jgi:hypothetical protein